MNLVESEAKSKSIKLNFGEDFVIDSISDLFLKEEIYVYFSNSKKYRKILNSNNKCIIFTDYRNFKLLQTIFNSNGYNYQRDIDYYFKKICLINDVEIIDYCTSSPH